MAQRHYKQCSTSPPLAVIKEEELVAEEETWEMVVSSEFHSEDEEGTRMGVGASRLTFPSVAYETVLDNFSLSNSTSTASLARTEEDVLESAEPSTMANTSQPQEMSEVAISKVEQVGTREEQGWLLQVMLAAAAIGSSTLWGAEVQWLFNQDSRSLSLFEQDHRLCSFPLNDDYYFDAASISAPSTSAASVSATEDDDDDREDDGEKGFSLPEGLKKVLFPWLPHSGKDDLSTREESWRRGRRWEQLQNAQFALGGGMGWGAEGWISSLHYGGRLREENLVAS